MVLREVILNGQEFGIFSRRAFQKHATHSNGTRSSQTSEKELSYSLLGDF